MFGYHELIYESEYTRPSNGNFTWTKAIIPTQMMETDDPYRMCCIELYQFKDERAEPDLLAKEDFSLQ